MSFSLRRRATSPASNAPSSRASWAWMAIWKRRSPSSSRSRSRSPESSAASASYASSSRWGRSDACVCSRSQGQPSGARRRSAMRVTVASDARSVKGSCGSSTSQRAPRGSTSARVVRVSRSPMSVTGCAAGYRARRNARSGAASSAMATARSDEKAWRSRAVAGTRSTPAGHRARATSSAVAAPGGSEGDAAPFDELLELEARDEPRDVVRLLLLIQPVRVRVVLDLLLLVVTEPARVVRCERLVPDGRRAVVVLLAPRPGVEREQLVLGTDVGEHPARDPAHVAALVLGVALLGELLRDLGEIGPLVERRVDVGDLLELRAELGEVAAGRDRRRDEDVRDVDLRDRAGGRGLLAALREVLANHVVSRVGRDVGHREPRAEPALDGVARLRAAALLDLDDVVAELRLHRVGHLPELHGGRGVLELLHELALADPAELASRVLGAGVVRGFLRELVPEVLVVRLLLELLRDAGRLLEGRLVRDVLVLGVLVRHHEDVTAAELAEVRQVARLDGIVADAHALAVRGRIEDRVLHDRVERAPFVLRLLLRDPRVVLEPDRDAEVDVELGLLVLHLAPPVAERDRSSIDRRGGFQVLAVIPIGRAPGHKAEHEEEDRREGDHDDRLLPTLALPARRALPLGEAWKGDPAGHLEDLKL